jgi:hypothetical protein
MKHRLIGGSKLFIACRNPPKLLKAVHQPLDAITEAVDILVEGSCSCFIGLARDGVVDAPPPQIRAQIIITVALVRDDSLRANTWAARPHALHRPLLHQRNEGLLVAPLTGGEHKGDGFTRPVRADMYLGAKATARVT